MNRKLSWWIKVPLFALLGPIGVGIAIYMEAPSKNDNRDDK